MSDWVKDDLIQFEADQYADNDIMVGCYCGWLGKESELIDGPSKKLKYCPRCGGFFEAIRALKDKP